MFGDDVPQQRVRQMIVDGHGQNFSDLPLVPIENHNSIAGGATGQLLNRSTGRITRGILAGSLHQNFHHLVNELPVLLVANLILDCQQFIISLLFDEVRHIIRQATGRRGAGSFTAFKNKAIFETKFSQCIRRLLMVCVRFSAKPVIKSLATAASGRIV